MTAPTATAAALVGRLYRYGRSKATLMAEDCREAAALIEQMETEFGLLANQLSDCEAERDALRAALRKYGAHSQQCKENCGISWPADVDCTCGLAAAIAPGAK